MNVLLLSLDPSLLQESLPTSSESRGRQIAYAQELRRRVPGSRLFIAVRLAPGMASQPTIIAEDIELYPAPASTIGFMTKAYSYGRQLCRQQGIHLITSQSPFSDGLVALLLKSQYKMRWLAQLHMSSLDNPYWLAESPVNYLRAWLGKSILRRADALRVMSESAAAWAQQTLRIGREKIFIIPVGTAMLSNSMPFLEKHVAGRNILFVGRLGREKGVSNLLYAVQRIQEQHHDVKLIIIGDGAEKKNLEGLSATLGLREHVSFMGTVPYEQLPQFYVNADVMVLPSLHESYGRTIVEAMIFECAVVATDTEGARDLIQDGKTGFIVPVQDVSALANRIQYLLENPQVAREMGRAARRFVERTQNPQALCMAQVEMWLKVASQ